MTRNKRAELKGPANRLPVPVTPAATGALPVLTEHGQLDADLSSLERSLEGHRVHGTHFYPSAAETASHLKAVLPFIDKWRAVWRALDRPATTDEIATEMLRLATTMPNAGNIDQGMLADTLCEDIAESRPTAWALARGCRAHRGKSEFLSFAKLEEEIRRAERRAAHYRHLLKRDMAEELKSAEDSVRYERRRHAEFKREQKLREKRLAEKEREARENERWLTDKRRELADEEALWLRDHKHAGAPDE
jgi:hypothetical protein